QVGQALLRVAPGEGREDLDGLRGRVGVPQRVHDGRLGRADVVPLDLPAGHLPQRVQRVLRKLLALLVTQLLPLVLEEVLAEPAFLLLRGTGYRVGRGRQLDRLFQVRLQLGRVVEPRLRQDPDVAVAVFQAAVDRLAFDRGDE